MTDLEKFIAKCEQNAKPDNEINLKGSPELTEEDFARGKLNKKLIIMYIMFDF